MAVELHLGDCLDVLKTLPDNSVDAVVTDPPYELGFMGKKWDSTGIAYNVNVWRECLRILKHGGHLLAFGGSRTYHRMAVAIEDAGFEVRDQIMWLYGSGFPKSHNISKAIDKMAGAEREVVGERNKRGMGGSATYAQDAWTQANIGNVTIPITKPATPAAKQWDGWGTALKPAHEPICVARKPLAENTVAENVLAWGTGAINIDGCRVAGEGWGTRKNSPDSKMVYGDYGFIETQENPQGRWPANVIHSGDECVVAGFPVTTSNSHGKAAGMSCSEKRYTGGVATSFGSGGIMRRTETDTGSAARFFYCAKASPSERGADNNHPTVKPQALMRYLCRLVTPPGGVILDPFMGSGSTGKGAVIEGFNFIGIEKMPEYFEIARARIDAAQGEPKQESIL